MWTQKDFAGLLYWEPFTVTIDDAYWNSNEQMYNLLIGTVAGAVERGTYHPDNCKEVQESIKDVVTKYRHCSTTNSVKVTLPGNNFMKVSFSAAHSWIDYTCAKTLDAVITYVHDLQPEMQAVTGDNDLYPDVQCIY